MGAFGRAIVLYFKECFSAKSDVDGWGAKVTIAVNAIITCTGAALTWRSIVDGWAIGPGFIVPTTATIVLFIVGMRMALRRVHLEDQAAHDLYFKEMIYRWGTSPAQTTGVRLQLVFRNQSTRHMQFRIAYGGVWTNDEFRPFPDDEMALVSPGECGAIALGDEYPPLPCSGQAWFCVHHDTVPPTRVHIRKYCVEFRATQGTHAAFMPVFSWQPSPWSSRRMPTQPTASPHP